MPDVENEANKEDDCPQELDSGQAVGSHLGGKGNHPRYTFIDQFRGVCVLFLSLSFVTLHLGRLQLVPAIFTHGFIFSGTGPVSWNGMMLENEFYSCIDIGSSIFMLLVGVTLPISFRSTRDKKGVKVAVLKLLYRVSILVAIQGVLDLLTFGTTTYRSLFLGDGDGVLSRIGVSSLFVCAAMVLVKNADRRMAVALGVVGCHAVLFLLPGLESFRSSGGFIDYDLVRWMGPGSFLDKYAIPFELMSFTALGISGTCFWDWFTHPCKQPGVAFKQRIIPVAMSVWMACFFTSWFIPFGHLDFPASQTLLSIGAGFFFLLVFFCFERYFQFGLSLFTALGRNSIFLYITGFLFSLLYLDFGLYNLISPDVAWTGMLYCAGEVVFVSSLAMFLHWKRVYFKL